MSVMIGTWKMSLEGVKEAHGLLRAGAAAGEAVVRAIRRVEDDPRFCSVGYGGLPGRDGRVTLDAGFMDGRTLRLGGVMSAEDIQNPIRAAYLLCGREKNCLLAGEGARQFALDHGLPLRDMRTEKSMARWHKAGANRPLSPYEGHDTVCVLALDEKGNMACGTSTSGLFMKEMGRVGDSPLVGSGFYCDNCRGAAAATGLGEDIMRGCLSYETVSLMGRGLSPQAACLKALGALTDRKAALGEERGSISLIALAPDGSWGAATTLPLFPFAVAGNSYPALYVTEYAPNPVMRPARAEELAKVD